MIPKPGEHCFIAGQTGSGKTAGACQVLLRLGRPVLVYDTKNEPRFETLPNAYVSNSWDAIRRQIDMQEQRFFVWRPETDDKAELDDALKNHYDVLPGVAAYIDEAYSFHKHGHPGEGLAALLTRGRSREISTIMATQRPAWISKFAITEARHHHIYKLAHQNDRKTIGLVIPQFVNSPEPVKHGFSYFNTDTGEFRLFGPWNINARGLDIPAPDVLDANDGIEGGAQSKPKPRIF